MAFFDQHPQHPQHGRQPSFDPSARSGGPMKGREWQDYPGSMDGSNLGMPGFSEDFPAFRSQFEGTARLWGNQVMRNYDEQHRLPEDGIGMEVERSHENLNRGARQPYQPMHGRRDSMPMMGQFVGQFPQDRMGPSPRHHSIDYESMRSSPSASGLQGYLSNQRFGPPRQQNDAESMLQAKRRAAAQRERELRNYHQEQQYNRSSKTDRAMSPSSAMSEEDRRELIARQHKALYGDSAHLYEGGGHQSRPMSQDARVLAAAAGGHGNSPLNFDQYGHPSGSSGEPTSGQGSRSRSNSTAPKDPNQGFAMFDNNRPTSSSPGDGQGGQHGPPGSGPIGPIGSRPPPSQMKRASPPAPSPLGQGGAQGGPPTSGPERHGSLSWNTGGGPWGPSSKGSIDQTSVWA